MGNPLVRFCRGAGEQPKFKTEEGPSLLDLVKIIKRVTNISDTKNILYRKYR